IEIGLAVLVVQVAALGFGEQDREVARVAHYFRFNAVKNFGIHVSHLPRCVAMARGRKKIKRFQSVGARQMGAPVSCVSDAESQSFSPSTSSTLSRLNGPMRSRYSSLCSPAKWMRLSNRMNCSVRHLRA